MENRFSSLTCGDQLIVEPMAMSITLSDGAELAGLVA
jgi:hypothetical protein